MRVEQRESQMRAIREKIAKLQRACGCVAGAVSVLLAMSLYGRFLLSPAAQVYGVGSKILTGFLVFFVSALIGKAVGIAIARGRLRFLQARLNDYELSSAA